MTSLVGPLVNPNTLEDHFDRIAQRRSPFRHPVLLLLLAAFIASATAAALYYHQIPF
ncbi:MAG: hypothetical protein WDM86_19875 [Rhizomicrobium sp.]